MSNCFLGTFLNLPPPFIHTHHVKSWAHHSQTSFPALLFQTQQMATFFLPSCKLTTRLSAFPCSPCPPCGYPTFLDLNLICLTVIPPQTLRPGLIISSGLPQHQPPFLPSLWDSTHIYRQMSTPLQSSLAPSLLSSSSLMGTVCPSPPQPTLLPVISTCTPAPTTRVPPVCLK